MNLQTLTILSTILWAAIPCVIIWVSICEYRDKKKYLEELQERFNRINKELPNEI